MLVVDASVAVKWVLDEPGSDAAAALLDEDSLAAPEFWLIEAANVLWKRRRRNELSDQQASAALDILMDAPVTPIRAASLLPEALRLALALGQPVHDCLYLAAASANGATLVTADQRLVGLATSDPALAARVRLLV